MAREAREWDMEFDVVVVGYGFAGGTAAIAAHDAGATVGLFEKMPHFGGNSILSGGSCVVGRSYGPTLAYLERTCAGTCPRPVLEALADGMVRLPAKLQRLATEVGFETVIQERGRWCSATYPFPGWEQIADVHVTRNASYQGFPWAKGTTAGGTLFWVVSKQVDRRPAIHQHYEAAVQELVWEGGEVRGVRVATGGRVLRVRAGRAVVLTCGGFEHNMDLQGRYLQVQNASAMSCPGNTGDGIVMAQEVGAALWHMWLVHGSYGFRVPEFPMAIRHDFNGYRDEDKPMPWIAVDRFGRRFMDEYPPAPQDTPIRALEQYDPDIQGYPRIPCFLIFDDAGRRRGPIGKPKINDDRISFEWSADNLPEVDKGYIRCAETVEDLATALGVEPPALRESVDRWNENVASGRDRDFRRPSGTMMALTTPPYYAIEAWPIITNTMGGPEHDAAQGVLDPRGRPIPRLYEAGELGSIFGHLYMLGGNLSECFIGGEIAGRNAAAEQPWRESGPLPAVV